MRNQSKSRLILGVIFIVASFGVIYSIIQIQAGNAKVEEAMKDVNFHQSVSITKRPLGSSDIDGTVQEQKDNEIESPYTSRPKEGELFGTIIIPSIQLEAPIIEGTDEEQLEQGVGHFIGSVLPGEWDNTVLAAHRDTIFKDLGKVEIGDQIKIETSAGTFTYEITNQRIVDADDRTVIVPYEKAVLTLVTCYPFDYIGPAPKRYILTGRLLH